jgi:PEP-CTERM motif-containing protein
MRRVLTGLAAVSAFAFSATAASAATTVINPCPSGNFLCYATQPAGTSFYVSGGDPMSGTDPLTASIGHTNIPKGSFTDLFEFMIGTTGQGEIGTGSGSVITFLINGVPNVDFTNVFFNNGTTDFYAEPGDITANSITISGVSIFGGALNTLHIEGTVPKNNGTKGIGSYGGSLGFTPGAVPEPATWTMMLLGFGAIGFSLRGKRRTALAQLA